MYLTISVVFNSYLSVTHVIFAVPCLDQFSTVTNINPDCTTILCTSTSKQVGSRTTTLLKVHIEKNMEEAKNIKQYVFQSFITTSTLNIHFTVHHLVQNNHRAIYLALEILILPGTLRFHQTWLAGRYTIEFGDFPIETPP